MLPSPTPTQLGAAFRRVQYSYHQRFFELLGERLPGKSGEIARELAALPAGVTPGRMGTHVVEQTPLMPRGRGGNQ